MKEIDVKQEAYFPFTFKFFAVILLVFGILTWTQHEWHFIIKCLTMVVSFGLGSAILTARYGLWVDPQKKIFKEYLQVLFWKTGEIKSYQGIEKIFINEVVERATMQTRTGSMHDVKNTVYKAFLKLNDDRKIQLDRDKKRGQLEHRVQHYREYLGVTE